jgi:hypothetical protein
MPLYIGVMICNLFVCFSILAGFEPVKKVLLDHYAVFYHELLENMLLFRKPVLTFGTHSLAGFFLYIFFYLNLRIYRASGRKLFYVFSVSYLLLTFALTSVTGLTVGALGVVQLFWSGAARKRRSWWWIVVVIIALQVLLLSVIDLDTLANTWNDGLKVAHDVLTSKNNGVLGRWAPGSGMYFGLEYIGKHPFSPVGISYRPEFIFVDCGWLEHMLRGSLPLVGLIYGGLFWFLRRNLVAKFDAYFLFTAIIAFEFGFSSLTFFRTLFLIPVFIVLLNYVRRLEANRIGRSAFSPLPNNAPLPTTPQDLDLD